MIHLVNGFLGSGKTTAIIGAVKYYLGQGKRVGVITNDKGKYLVDTAFFQQADVPTAQVGGGCFRCNFDEFENQMDQLIRENQPEIIFAESVGSCVDLVNTVVDPLREYQQYGHAQSTYSVFTDVRLLSFWVNDIPLPFNDSIVYTFGKQIEETSLLVVNKIDLISAEELAELKPVLAARYPEKTILYQVSLDQINTPWVQALETGRAGMPEKNEEFSVDYQRYAAGELSMAWVDEAVEVDGETPDVVQKAAESMIASVLAQVQEMKLGIAHLKVFVRSGGQSAKISFTAADRPETMDWRSLLPGQFDCQASLLFNARIETRPYVLYDILSDAQKQAAEASGAHISPGDARAFQPQVPPPGERYTPEE